MKRVSVKGKMAGIRGPKNRDLSKRWRAKPIQERVLIERRERMVGYARSMRLPRKVAKPLIGLFNSNRLVRMHSAYDLSQLSPSLVKGRLRKVLKEALDASIHDAEAAQNVRAALERFGLLEK